MTRAAVVLLGSPCSATDSGTFDSSITGVNDRLHSDDLGRVTLAPQTAIDTCGNSAAAYPPAPAHRGHPLGVRRDRTLCSADGTAVRLLGTAYDIIDQRAIDDDVAVVAVRPHPDDRPHPAEAGP
ncbi:hypothetical protein [Modestobacter sp. KNN46-3]|jgi:hypothetical protein|uniref:hypothetical protein n=1 Tax=Modestobacter sp. KNN46-3 TaxID=2711218 RepID=UPI0013DF55E1|nr:hypothetical protein [Modestobacter sp. KNN46-3]